MVSYKVVITTRDGSKKYLNANWTNNLVKSVSKTFGKDINTDLTIMLFDEIVHNLLLDKINISDIKSIEFEDTTGGEN